MSQEPAVGVAGAEKKGLIAFVQDGNICLINFDGSGFKQLTTSGRCSYPAWTPDGQRIVFVSGGQVWVMKYDGTERRRLTRMKGWSCEHPNVSRDGKKIVFRAYRYIEDEAEVLDTLRVMNMDGSNLRTVASEQAFWTPFRDPSFTPDGSAILCNEHGTGTGEACLKVVSLKTGRSRVLYGNGRHKSFYDCYAPAFSPDGKRIVAEASCWVAASGFMYLIDGGIVVMNADGSNPKLFKGVGEQPAWSADGQEIIAVSVKGLVAFDLKTQAVKVIFPSNRRIESPACQPLR
jgi:Tol biopolymer transport system component